MTAVNRLLDKYREACKLPSDNAAAERLGITRQSVHQWRKGASWPSDDHVITMATAIKEPAEEWFVAIHAERTSPAARQVWLRLASRLATAAVIVMTLGVTRIHAEAAKPLQGATFNSPVYTLCAIAEAAPEVIASHLDLS